jgi:hypothetical protein
LRGDDVAEAAVGLCDRSLVVQFAAVWS